MAKRMKEGFRVKDIDAFSSFIPYVMVERSDSQNTINESFDVAPTEKFIREMRAEGLDSFGVLHVILGSYVRMVSQRISDFMELMYSMSSFAGLVSSSLR